MLVVNLILLLQIVPAVITNIGNWLSIVSHRCASCIWAELLLNGRDREFLKISCNLSTRQPWVDNLVVTTLRKHFLY